MATAAIETRRADESKQQHQQGAGAGGGEGLRQYYQQRIQDMQLLVRQKDHDLQRLEAQRNDLNSRGFFSLVYRIQFVYFNCRRFLNPRNREALPLLFSYLSFIVSQWNYNPVRIVYPSPLRPIFFMGVNLFSPSGAFVWLLYC